MSEISIIALIFSAIRLATPLIFAGLGGMFSERSGVINIALEGLMLAGAFTGAVVTYEVGNPYLGMLAGMVAGAASESPRCRTLPAFTSSAIAPMVSSIGMLGSTRCW